MSVIDICISVFDVGHSRVSIPLMQGGTTAVWTTYCSRSQIILNSSRWCEY